MAKTGSESGVRKVVGPRVGIREVRKAYGLTLEQLADRIAAQGCPRPDADSLSNIERGNRQAGHALLSAWSRSLDIHPLNVEQDPDVGQPLATVHRPTRATA